MTDSSETSIAIMNGTPNIPQELIDRILDFFHSSVPSLACSSLVSKNWLPTSRYHLFRTPVLYQLSYGRPRKDNTKSFIELLGSPVCTFRQSVQSCVLNIEKVSILQKCIDALAANTTLTDKLLITQYNEDVSFTTGLQIPPKFPLIRNFVYSNSDAWPEDLPQLVTSLPHLESLSIYAKIRGIDKTPDFPVIPGDNVLRNLRTLRLRMFNPSRFLSWLISLPGYKPQLDTLDIAVYSSNPSGWSRLRESEPFLAANRETLKDLKVGIEYQTDLPHGHDESVSQIDIRSLLNLKSLTLRTHDIASLCETIASFLKCTPVSLYTLTVHLIPFIFGDGSRFIEASENDYRAKLRETFGERFFDKIGSLRILLFYPFTGMGALNEANLVKMKSLSTDLLPNWNSRSVLDVEIIQGRYWQVESLESTNIAVWDYAMVPYFKNLIRVGTL